ncbi:cation transporter [Ideonella paludis]|uniref:Cation transporter n=1 Tax=Ideonella paludis TaxID=1233411 RepID=A0ABS5E1S3_9BURK|nr:cation transporter [Ideonella paludis]MBQ0937360.1 cation transporter [Ideonella paludis]
MSGHCCDHDHAPSATSSPRYRRVLWAALLINLGMAVVEIISSRLTGSVSLLADAADFMGDAANYGVSLWVLGVAAVWRARTAWLKGLSMGLYGLGVLAVAGWQWWQGSTPEAASMGLIGALALAANLSVAALLYAFREGDANMRAVWLCTRNDAIGNVAVLVAAGLVMLTGQAWPDLAVAAGMAALALTGGVSVMRQAQAELRWEHGGAEAHRTHGT